MIIKPYGKFIPYTLLDFQVQELWKLVSTMHLIDLGHDYYRAYFQLEEGLHLNLSRGTVVHRWSIPNDNTLATRIQPDNGKNYHYDHLGSATWSTTRLLRQKYP